MAIVDLYFKHWRDTVMILTALLVAGSLALIAYGIASERNQINCIARFFAQSNRQNKVVSNITTCKIDLSN